MNHSPSLTALQQRMLWQMSALVFLQLVILCVVVVGIARSNQPDWVYRYSERHPWIFFLGFFFASTGCIVGIMSTISTSQDPASDLFFFLRVVLFLGLGILFALFLSPLFYIMTLSYVRPPRGTRRWHPAVSTGKRFLEATQEMTHRFLVSVFFALFLYLFVCFAIVPNISQTGQLLRLSQIQGWLFGLLLVLILVGILSLLFWTVPLVSSLRFSQGYLLLSLLVFVGFLIVDTVLIVRRCQKEGSRECDAPSGATVLYLDIINLIQKFFLLLSMDRRQS